MATQTGIQAVCHETGRMKNCGTYAEYEDGHTGSASMCNGGSYDGDSYSSCPSRTECMAATVAAERDKVSQIRAGGGTVVVGSTPNVSRPFQAPPPNTSPEAPQQPAYAPTWEDVYAKYCGGIPTTMPARTSYTPGNANPPATRPPQQQAQPPMQQAAMMQYPTAPYPAYVPTPIRPPTQFPTAMQSQFAAPIPFHAGGITPTFLPDNDEGILERLIKNVGQGMIGSSGWHVFDLARSVDFFGKRRR